MTVNLKNLIADDFRFFGGRLIFREKELVS